jgi:regulator of sigma E protease
MNGTVTRNTIDINRVLKGTPQRVVMYVLRHEEIVQLTMNLTYDKGGKTDPGFDFASIVVRSPNLGFFGSIARGAEQTVGLIVAIVRGFGMLFSIKITGINDVVAGPVQITMMMGERAVEGFSLGLGEGLIQFIQFINIISVFISFMNLLPIPALDGGQAVLSVILAARKNTSLKFVYRYQLVGFVFIFALIVLAIASDVFKYL